MKNSGEIGGFLCKLKPKLYDGCIIASPNGAGNKRQNKYQSVIAKHRNKFVLSNNRNVRNIDL